MKLPLVLTVGILVAAAPAGADTAAPPAQAAEASSALAGKLANKASSCGAAYKGDARFDIRRSVDGMGAATIKVRRGKKAAAALEPGTYDVRIYLYQRRAFRYITTRHMEVAKDRWEASFGCAPGSKEPSLSVVETPRRLARRR